MLRFSSALVLLALVAVADGAALIRFINTVPTRLDNTATLDVAVGGVYPSRVTDKQNQQDRVGIQYFPANTISTVVQSPTILWTEVLNERSADVTTGGMAGTVPENAAIPPPYAWTHAMPALRQYHLVQAGAEVPAVDRVSAYMNAQMATGKDVTNDDNYDQTFLKEDGVGLYLSIAAGTYQMQAYAAIDPNTGTGGLTSNRQVQARAYAGSLSTYTFADNAVYTLVATGNGAFGTSTTGNSVKLVLMQESVDPTTFGMASLRWFHAIKTLATSTIDIYTGQTTSTANRLATGIKFGGLTQYFDIAPSTSMQTVLTVGGSTSVIAAPSTATKLEVTADVRAGMRATMICAVNNDVTERVFCRMIPSRVVAYVRMVNDLSGQESLEQGLLGPTMLKDNPLSLWASYEFPRPDQAVPMSQVSGNRYMTNHPAMNRGLYPVLSNVVSGGCTGYGEVFVPLMIMDYATRFTIIRNNAEMGGALPWSGVYTAAGMTNQNNPTVSPNTQWFWGAATHKRINFNVKTSGLSTIIGKITGDALGTSAFRFYGTGTAAANSAAWFSNPVYLDNYMEPGQYYSIIATSSAQDLIVGGAYTPVKFPDTRTVTFFFRLDRTVDMVAGGVPSGKSIVNWIPFNQQDFTPARGAINFRPTSGNVNLSPTIAATGTYANQATATVQPWNAPASALFVDPGNYIFDYTPVAASLPCVQKIPGTNPITVSAGNITDIFLLNTFGCVLNNNNENKLIVSSCLTQSARTSGNAVGTLLTNTGFATNTNSVYFAAASSISASVLSVLLSTLLVLLATL